MASISTSSGMLELLLQLGRLKMTVFSAVTYAAGATLAVHLDPGQFNADQAVL
jgi:hypothetical protein